jgi:hypothetical protein
MLTALGYDVVEDFDGGVPAVSYYCPRPINPSITHACADRVDISVRT